MQRLSKPSYTVMHFQMRLRSPMYLHHPKRYEAPAIGDIGDSLLVEVYVAFWHCHCGNTDDDNKKKKQAKTRTGKKQAQAKQKRTIKMTIVYDSL